MLRTTFGVLALCLATLFVSAPSARAGLVAQEAAPAAHQDATPGSDFLQAHQYNLADTRIAGQDSIHQKVTAWEVTTGTWNGESLNGLSVVLVQTNDDAQSQHTTNCYVSHMATPAAVRIGPPQRHFWPARRCRPPIPMPCASNPPSSKLKSPGTP